MNPVKKVREAHSLTQRAFASLAGVSEQIVVRAESGMFGTLPPSIVKAVQTFTGESYNDIINTYERWVDKELMDVVLPHPEADALIATPENFKKWKGTVCLLNNLPDTTVGFCKVFKLHPYVIEKWESGKMKQPPVQLVQRLAHMRGII